MSIIFSYSYVSHTFSFLCIFFFNDTATTEIYTLSLHDALPISPCPARCICVRRTLRPARRCRDRKSTRLNSSHVKISYAVFCLKKKKIQHVLVYKKKQITNGRSARYVEAV